MLKEGGIAGIILPSSMLSNTGIYTKTREIILQKFDIIAIAELGSNTFMATGTNTVVLFLRRKNDVKVGKILETAHSVFVSPKDITINGIENAVSAYLKHGWNGLSVEDYATFLQKNPNKKVKEHPTYKEYRPKEYTVEDLIGEDTSILAREYAEKQLKQIEDAFWERVLKVESEKLFYFVLAYPQTIVLVKTGAKDAEKRFLGYEFSNRRGSEGIHPIERSRRIDDCTRLFDETNVDNPEKASAYIYRAFKGDVSSPVAESMRDNVFRLPLADTLAFDRNSFEKNLSLVAKKKIEVAGKYPMVKLGDAVIIEYGERIVRKNAVGNKYPVYGGGGETFRTANFNRESRYIISRFGMSPSCVRFVEGKFFLNDSGMTLASSSEKLLQKYLDNFIWSVQDKIYTFGRGSAQKNIDMVAFKNFVIPLPPKEIQEKIVAEIEAAERLEEETANGIIAAKQQIKVIIQACCELSKEKLGNIAVLLKRGKSARYGNSSVQIIKSGQARGYYHFDFSERYFVDAGFVSDARQLQKQDILINSTGVGTAGRITLFNLDGDFVVDSHITILRVNQEKALPVFVLYALADGIGFKNIESMAQGQSGQVELSLSTIKNITIPLPSLIDQRQIIAKIAKLETRIEELQKQLEQFPIQKEQILKKYL